MPIDLPADIANALGPIPGALADFGFAPMKFEKSAAFGSFVVVFACGEVTVSVIRDRGQFQVDGAEQAVLEAAGLWRNFSGPAPIVAPLLEWLGARLRANQSLEPTLAAQLERYPT